MVHDITSQPKEDIKRWKEEKFRRRVSKIILELVLTQTLDNKVLFNILRLGMDWCTDSSQAY